MAQRRSANTSRPMRTEFAEPVVSSSPIGGRETPSCAQSPRGATVNRHPRAGHSQTHRSPSADRPGALKVQGYLASNRSRTVTREVAKSESFFDRWHDRANRHKSGRSTATPAGVRSRLRCSYPRGRLSFLSTFQMTRRRVPSRSSAPIQPSGLEQSTATSYPSSPLPGLGIRPRPTPWRRRTSSRSFPARQAT